VIGIFKQKAPGNIALLFVFGLLIKLPLFLAPKAAVSTPLDGKMYQWVSMSLQGQLPVVSSIVAFLLLYIQALQVTNMVNEFRMIAKPTFLPGMAYLLVTSLLPEWSYLSAALIANTFIIWGFIKLFELYNLQGANGKIFNIGLLLGIASFFFFPSFLFAVSVLIGLMILRPFRLNELVLLLFGISAPFYFYGVYLFLFDRLSIQQLFPRLSFNMPVLKNSIWQVGSTLLLGIPFLMGGYYIQTHLRKMLIQARKTWSIVLLYLLLAIVVPFTNNTFTYTSWVVAAAPFAAFHACAFYYPVRRWLPVVLFYLMLAFILVQQFVTKTWVF
jgi:hypothetical protein